MAGSSIVVADIAPSSGAGFTLQATPLIITAGTVMNRAAATGYALFFDATSTANITLGTTLPYAIFPHSSGDNDPLTVGRGLQFYHGCIAYSMNGPTGTSTTGVSCMLQVIIE